MTPPEAAGMTLGTQIHVSGCRAERPAGRWSTVADQTVEDLGHMETSRVYQYVWSTSVTTGNTISTSYDLHMCECIPYQLQALFLGPDVERGRAHGR